ncbi:hypothetical protein BGX21_009477 [Mortierella sp. AD011]|nr:hypothetical protein BGX20_005888 [Mortierella sp. AD010]KAF9396582.1 hypothetical protein BGX21_009477 [Mortierella sp. AD011]
MPEFQSLQLWPKPLLDIAGKCIKLTVVRPNKPLQVFDILALAEKRQLLRTGQISGGVDVFIS